MASKNEIDSMKWKMINTFYFEVNQIFYNYFNENINNFKFNHQINHYFDAWKIGRIDLRNRGSSTNSIKSLNEDGNLDVKYPKWLDNGRGCVVEIEKSSNLEFECNGKGELMTYLKGVDFRNSAIGRIPVFIIYKKLTINDEVIFNEDILCWHNKQYTHKQNCENNEKINIKIEFETIYDHFPKLNEYKNKILKTSEEGKNIEKEYKQFEKYMVQQKFELGKAANDESFLLNEHLELTEKFNELRIEFNTFKKDTNKILDSYNILFDSLFKYHVLEPKSVVKQSRELNNQLLDFIDNVCKKYDLKWWLSFGNLIGAIRHEGNVPWDDDVDICMMRDDYDRFFEIIRNEVKLNKLDKHIRVNINKKGPNNSLLSFMKFEYFDKDRLYGFVDIIPFDYANSIIDNAEYVFLKEHRKYIAELKKGANRDELLNNYFKLFDVSKTKTDIIISGIEQVKYAEIGYNTIFPLKTVKYEDRYYPSPNDSEKMLELKYGDDFMKVPKTVHHHNFYDVLSTKREDAFETFERNIALLQEVNSKLSKNITN